MDLCFDFEHQTITVTYNEDYALSFLPRETIREIIHSYKGHVNWMEEQHRKLELKKFNGYFVEGDGKQMICCMYTKEYGFDQVDQLVKDLKYLLYAEEEPEENIPISEFDWEYFEEVTEKMRERIENETPFKYGETIVTDFGFSYELVDERGLGSGIELYENVNMEIGLIYTLGGYEINKSFKFSEVDEDRIVEHLRKLHEQIQEATYY